jgi:hypothetical protein
MWFENGKGGLPTGHLGMGQETTTSTYEGHVFFFTVSGNKSEEVGRFKMEKNQVSFVALMNSFTAITTLSLFLKFFRCLH